MKKYKFILKPLFFIGCLLFASWLVITIERTSPSDFGKYQSLFEKPKAKKPKKICNEKECILCTKTELSEICAQYNAGEIDSADFENQLDLFIEKFHSQHSSLLKIK